jgi:hypothetical protein
MSASRKTAVRLALCGLAFAASGQASAQYSYCARDVTRPNQLGCDPVPQMQQRVPVAQQALPGEAFYPYAPVVPVYAYPHPQPIAVYPPAPVVYPPVAYQADPVPAVAAGLLFGALLMRGAFAHGPRMHWGPRR